MIEDPELRGLFQAENEERLLHLEEMLKILEGNPHDAEALESAFRDAHTIKGSSRMLGIQSIEVIAHRLEDSLDAARKGTNTLSHSIIQVIYESLQAIQLFVDEAVMGSLANVDLAGLLEKLTFKEMSASSVLIKVEQTPTPPKKQEDVPKAVDKPVDKASDLPSNISQHAVEIKKEKKETPKKEEKAEKSWERPQTISTIRIDMQYIMDMMNQAADLTVAKNRIIRLFECVEELWEFWEKKNRLYQFDFQMNENLSLDKRIAETGDNTSSNEMNKFLEKIGNTIRLLRNDAYEDTHKLEVIIISIVDSIRKLSLVPLSKVFELFPRMVRDLAKASNKEIELTIEGGEISVDKKIVEEIKDPLMHLLRNSISHGIELPQDREHKSKPRQGVIRLIGRQTPSSVLIEVSDDGQGLDTERIKRTAIQRDIVSEEVAATLTPSEIHSLIFLAGFSTASQITDISGRGVGMDVVKNQIEKLNGNLTIESNPGHGCRFIIQLSITHITTHILLVQVDERTYGIPIDMVEACLFISLEQISTLEGHDIISLHNQPLSILFLRNLIGSVDKLPPENTQINNQFCVIIKAYEKRAAVVVDNILDEQKVVVVPPDRLLFNVRIVAGTTILKTGEVCFILNPVNLLQIISKEPESHFKQGFLIRKT